MRVMTGHSPHAHHQHKANNKDKGFADMYEKMAANKHCKDKPKAPANNGPIVNMTIRGFHCCCGTRIQLTAEQHSELIGLKNMKPIVEPADSSVLQKYEPDNAGRVLSESKPYVAEPKYPKSIYDIPADELKSELMGALKACAALDTGGMSKAEIYNQIESIYKDFLGGDFKEPVLIGRGFSDHSGGGFSERSIDLINAYHEFERRLTEHGINTEESQTVREARGYDGMSDSDIKAAVRGQYPEVMTLKDCILMSQELRKLGFEEEGAYAYRVKDRIFSTMGLGWSPEAQKIFDAMLDMPADFDATMSKYEAFAKNDYTRYLPQNADEMFGELMSWIGGSEQYSQEMLKQIRSMLNDMEKSGELGFDKYGYCMSTTNL